MLLGLSLANQSPVTFHSLYIHYNVVFIFIFTTMDVIHVVKLVNLGTSFLSLLERLSTLQRLKCTGVLRKQVFILETCTNHIEISKLRLLLFLPFLYQRFLIDTTVYCCTETVSTGFGCVSGCICSTVDGSVKYWFGKKYWRVMSLLLFL